MIVQKLMKLPVVLVAIFIVTMFILDALKFGIYVDYLRHSVVPVVLLVFSVLLVVAGGYLFQKAKTTHNPMTPEKATKLVTTGVYSISRNPMYIGLVTLLAACVIYIGSMVNLLLLPLFVFLVNKLYIIPEERALEKIFKDEFIEYTARVRRWI